MGTRPHRINAANVLMAATQGNLGAGERPGLFDRHCFDPKSAIGRDDSDYSIKCRAEPLTGLNDLAALLY